jgi:hypothetical protein
VVLGAAWPAGSEFLGDTDDWLRLVFTHEFTHIVHLDRSEGWARVARAVVGRLPLTFPNLFLPEWQIEGLATFEESALTGGGRLHAGDFLAIVGEAGRAGRLEPLDRLNGGLTDWPDGHASYAYGSLFHAYLADRFGPQTLRQLAERTAGRVPFLGSPAFKHVYGASLGTLWRDFQAGLAAGAAEPESTAARRLTHHGFTVVGPRYVPPACAACPRQVVYSVRTPEDFPTLNRLTLDGSPPVPLETRYLGSTVAAGRRALVYDQLEFKRNAGLYSDLYALDLTSGRVERMTSEARLIDPDLSPDERTYVAVQQAAGRRALVLLDAASLGGKPPLEITTLLSEPDVQFNAPRWAPHGRLIAVERHRLGSGSEVVVVDPASRRADVIGSIPGGRVVTPDWTPDGAAIVAAAARDQEAFNLFEFRVDRSAPPRQLTHTAGGATWPDVSPDGEAIVFVGQTAQGSDLFEIPYPGQAISDERRQRLPDFTPGGSSSSSNNQPDAVAGADTAIAAGARSYSPWATLVPTWWSPVFEGEIGTLRFGAATGGTDTLGYHSYSAQATWLISNGDDLARRHAHPDWSVSYVYGRWQPAFWGTASSGTTFFGEAADEALRGATLRRRQLEAGVSLPSRRVRLAQTSNLSFVDAVEHFTRADGRTATARVNAGRAAWSLSSARTYGYSISREDGVRVGATAEFARGESGSATSVTADGRFYLPSSAPHHVVAVRLAAGTSSGDPAIGRTFHLGGPAQSADILSFDRRAISLLRGFPADSFAGRHVGLLNIDYRWPLARPQRGTGTFPLFVHSLHAALFVDAGRAWNEGFRVRDVQSSFGGELSFKVTAGYAMPLTATIGAARGHDGSGTVADRTSFYIRLGQAF